MKYIFILAAIILFNNVSAQQDDLHYFQKGLQKKLKAPLFLPPGQSSTAALVVEKNPPVPGTFSHTTPDGNKLYLLTQDHMPCVVPDMSTPNMPNAGKDIKIQGFTPNAIPNPGIREKPLLPEPPSLHLKSKP